MTDDNLFFGNKWLGKGLFYLFEAFFSSLEAALFESLICIILFM